MCDLSSNSKPDHVRNSKANLPKKQGLERVLHALLGLKYLSLSFSYKVD